MPGIQGRHFGAALTIQTKTPGCDGTQTCHFPAALACLSLQNDEWLHTHVAHFLMLPYNTYTLDHMHTCKSPITALLVKSTRHCITRIHTLSLIHTYRCTHMQTGILTVVLQYSAPGVGGRGNKVVFISSSLGVL